MPELVNRQSDEIKARHFIRFYCECLLWNATLGVWGKQEFLDSFYSIIFETIKDLSVTEQFEYLISFLKVASRPFLYYRENEKKAIMVILHTILSDVLNDNQPFIPANCICDNSGINMKNDNSGDEASTPALPDNYNKELISLLIILITCLSSIESNYLLNVERIKKLCSFIGKYDLELLRFNRINHARDEKQGFYSIIANNFKRVISGISGMEKSQKIDNSLKAAIEESAIDVSTPEGNTTIDLSDLFKVLYLENIQQSLYTDKTNKEIQSAINDDVINKYRTLCEKIIQGMKIQEKPDCHFYIPMDRKPIRLSTIIKNNSDESERFIISIPDQMISISGNAHYDNTRSIFLDNTTDSKTYNEQINIAQEKLQETGFYEFQNRIFWLVFQCVDEHYVDKQSIEDSSENNTDKSSIYTKDNENEIQKPVFVRNVFLKVSFENSDLSNYTALRNILIFRKTINEIIHTDINTGALDNAINAIAAKRILQSNKVQSHGQSTDIEKLFDIVYNSFKSTSFRKVSFKRTYEERSSKTYDCYDILNLFMNRCIAFGATRKLVDTYFRSPQPDELSPFCIKTYRLLYPSGSDSESKEHQDAIAGIKSYISVLNNDNYKKRMKKNIEKRRKESNNVKPFSEIQNITIETPNLDDLKYIYDLPYFVTNIPNKKKAAPLCLIGILDTLVRNAIEHSADCKVMISFIHGENAVDEDHKLEGANYTHSYRFTVSNKARPIGKNDLNGMTHIFFTQYLYNLFFDCNPLPNSSSDGDSLAEDILDHFYITMNQKEDNTYEASLVVVVKDFSIS